MGALQVGVHLSKELMRIAGHSLKANITTLGPLVLPLSEQLLFLGNLFARKARSRQALHRLPDKRKLLPIYTACLVALPKQPA